MYQLLSKRKIQVTEENYENMSGETAYTPNVYKITPEHLNRDTFH